MSKFKVGDRVKLIGSGYSFDGKEGTITDVRGEYSDVEVDAGEGNWLVASKWLTVVTEHIDSTVPIVNVGVVNAGDYLDEIYEDAKTGTDKRRFSLFNPLNDALRAVLDVMESGNTKLPWRDAYPIDSWHRKTGDYDRRYHDALMRHIMDDIEGKDFTEDTQLYTLAAAAVNALFLLQFKIEETGKPPSSDGKREIKSMKEGKDPYV